MDLNGKHALVTGGGQGIGWAIAQRLLQQGATVTICGRNAERLRQRLQQCDSARLHSCVMDITDSAGLAERFAAIVSAAGPVDILINNAGQAASAPILKTDPALWQNMLNVNLSAQFFCIQQVLPGMLERSWGRIVNIASTAGLKGYAYVSAYCAAKHGLVGLTRALAMELAQTGVTVNAVCPGYTDTEIVAEASQKIARLTGCLPEQARARLAHGNPQQRLVEPEEVADAVGWLCSPAATAMTGQSIAVAGGEVM